jgi:hypothetical protein
MDANNMRFGTALDAGGNPSIDLYRWQGTSTNYKSARISCLTDGSISILNATANSTDFSAQSFTERARITSSGQLLVGTSTARSAVSGGSPLVQIEGGSGTSGNLLSAVRNSNDVYSASIILGKTRGTVGTTTIVQNNDWLGYIAFDGADGGNLKEGASIKAEVDGTPGPNDMPGRLVFSTTADGASSPTERMRINSQGSTGVIAADTSGISCFVASQAGGAGATRLLFQGRYSATAVYGGTECFKVTSAGDVLNTNNSYGAISDAKLKENIVDANSQWNDLKALKVRNYNFKEGQTHTQIGLIAQEVELVSPGLVSESPDRDEDGNDLGTVTKSVNYSVLYMKAVKALQEAMERIEVLEQRLTDAGIA